MLHNSPPLRVALLSLHSSPLAPLGGIDAGGMNLYVTRLAGELTQRGMAVDIFTRRSDAQVRDVIQLESGGRLIHLDAGPRRRLPKSVLPLHLPAMVSSFRAFLAREEIEYDLLHSHYWLSGLAAMRYRLQENRPIPLVHMFHTLAKLKEFYLQQPDPNDSALRFDGERCLIGRADVVVGATEDEYDEMASLYGRTPGRYAVIPPGVDLELFSPRPQAESRRRLGITAKQVVVFVGRRDRLKGLDVLLRSVAALPEDVRRDLKVLLLGGQKRDQPPGERRMVAKLGLESIVEFRGAAGQSDLPWYYSAADVCAVPSAYESFGMVATEAMACQTPVVAFRVGGLATTITDGRTGFLAPPGNPGAYAAKLAEALLSPGASAIGRRARMAVQRYSWEGTADRTVSLYQELVHAYRCSALEHTAAR